MHGNSSERYLSTLALVSKLILLSANVLKYL